MSVGNRVKYKIGTFSRNRACIGADTYHRARYFFLQYLYWYENVVPGPVISTSTNTGTISRESTDFIFYPVPYALACQK